MSKNTPDVDLLEASQYALGFFRQFRDNLSTVSARETQTRTYIQRMDIINQHIEMLEQAITKAKCQAQ